MMGILAAPAAAQRGWISGTVADSLGVPLAYANLFLDGYPFGAMTDTAGTFKFEAPPGRYTLRVMKFGYRNLQLPVAVDRGENVEVHLALALRQEVRRGELVEVGMSRVSPDVVSEEELQSWGSGVYPESSTPVRSGPLELSVRYLLTEDGDSIGARVVAEGKNVTGDAVTICGCFSFWKVEYSSGPEWCDSIPLGGSRPYPGRILQVDARECDSPALDCDPVVLEPSESYRRELSFAFRPRDFEVWTGEIHVTCIFFHGRQGGAWGDTERAVLTPLPFRVPIRPIGMPYRRR